VKGNPPEIAVRDDADCPSIAYELFHRRDEQVVHRPRADGANRRSRCSIDATNASTDVRSRSGEEFAGTGKIGTTGRGIGPAYETKVSRYGIRVGDLLDPDILRDKIEFAYAEKNPVLAVYGKPAFDPKKLYDDYTRFGEVLADRITNSTVLINESIRAGSA
jgi:adenylosuccinate synthase